MSYPRIDPTTIHGISTGSIQIYLRKVDDEYNDLNTDIMVKGFSYTNDVANKYRNDWMVALGRWKEFFDENESDWIISDDVYNEATEYHEILKGFRKRFSSVFGGQKPSNTNESPVPKTTDEKDKETSAMDIYIPVGLGIMALVALGYMVRSVR